MTQNKGQKAAIRRRMAETGEPYVVARRMVLGEASGASSDVDGLTPEEQYVLEARAAGVSAEEIDG
jgi:hypothetical protein